MDWVTAPMRGATGFVDARFNSAPAKAGILYILAVIDGNVVIVR